MISVNLKAARGDSGDEQWAAELTMAAYLVALRHCAARRWLDLQLELWRALSATIANGGCPLAAPREPNESAEDFMAELALVAYRIALPYGRRRSFLDLELELYQTLRGTMEHTANGRR